MIQNLEAVFDGEVFHPEFPLNLKAGTRVRLIVESLLSDVTEQPKTFLETAKSLQLQGEPDWSENIDRYLYGSNIDDNE
jgi:predicted DNA-binding antitoxin AbrB/MazE fold protein